MPARSLPTYRFRFLPPFRWLTLAAAALAGAWVVPSRADSPTEVRARLEGRVTGCEHFAFTRARVAGGLGGPAREAAKSWHVSLWVAPDGTAYALDAENCQVYRIKEGTVRLLAGDGRRGWRDGPADRARFDFGVGSYQDADIKGDAAGNLYVSEALPGRLRKIARDAAGVWHVTTVAGGGTRTPTRGQDVPALQMKQGCAARFALAPDGTAVFAGHGGVYRVQNGRGTLVASRDELAPLTGPAAFDWHVGGSHLAPDGSFFWMPGGGPRMYRLDSRTGQADHVAGLPRIAAGLDGPTPRESGFHTVFVAYAPDASVFFTGGGDEEVLRRVARGQAAHLQQDGAFVPGGRTFGWRLSSPLAVDARGCLYTETGAYAWGGWLVRLAFAPAGTP